LVIFPLFFFSAFQWYTLCVQAAYSRNAALADSTKSNIRTHLKSYILFCLYFQVPPFPVVLEVLIPYIQVLANSHSAPGSIKTYLSGLQTACRFLNIPCPDLSHFLIVYHLKGAARILQHLPQRATPLTPAILTRIFFILPFHHPYLVSWWAALVVGFFTFARIDNLLPRSNRFNPIRELCRSDFIFHDHAITVVYRYSKTNQLGSRTLSVPISPMSSPLCPVRAVNNMFHCSPAHPSAPGFSYTIHPRNFPITQASFISTLRYFLSALNLQASTFSGHSMRRGGATHAFRAGVPSELIKSHGDWASDAYLTYLHISDSQKLQVTQLMGNHT